MTQPINEADKMPRPTAEEVKKLDEDLRSLGYDPEVIGKKGDALARLCYQNELNKAIIAAQKRHLDQNAETIHRLSAQRRQIVEEAGEILWHFSFHGDMCPMYLGGVNRFKCTCGYAEALDRWNRFKEGIK